MVAPESKNMNNSQPLCPSCSWSGNGEHQGGQLHMFDTGWKGRIMGLSGTTKEHVVLKAEYT